MINKINNFFTLQKLKKRTDKILKIQKRISNLSDKELQEQIKNKKDIDEKLAYIKEASKRVLGKDPYEVQIMGVLTIINENIAEMQTGEGKSLTAAIAALALALSGRKVYIVTVNEYLAQRDLEEHSPLFDFFSVSSSIIKSNEEHRYKKYDYMVKIIYSTALELGFNYLRDHMEKSIHDTTQSTLDFVIIDEVDSILIDEASTPLIISEKIDTKISLLKEIHQFVLKLEQGEEIIKKEFLIREKELKGDFILDKKNGSVYLTEQGIAKIEKFLKIENLYDDKHIHLLPLIENSIKANYYYKKETHYVIKDNKLILIDQNTGRLTPDRQLAGGINQAIEIKEGIEVSPFTISKGEISYQKFFELFKSRAGMTGTAKTEEQEFKEIYKMDVIQIPTHKPIQRNDLKDRVFIDKKSKDEYLLKTVIDIHKTARPILIVTPSVETNEYVANLLKKEHLKFEILNAKNEEKEAMIIKKAGQQNSIIIATNMAGRGVDIKLDDDVKEKGGLFVIGYERFYNERIDNQLRGRAGRQGNPGDTLFLISLDDEIIKTFGNLKETKKILEMTKDSNKTSNQLIQKLIIKLVKNAQKTIAYMQFEQRKEILKYDNIIGEQRNTIYSLRKQILETYAILEKVKELISFIAKDIIFIDIFDVENLTDEDKQNIKQKISKELMLYNFPDFDNINEFQQILINIINNNLKPLQELSLSNKENLLNINQVIREIYLKNIDKYWIEHLTHLEQLREGIHLRAYNQKDPVIEFQKDSFYLFEKMLLNIRKDIIKDLIFLSIKTS